MIVHQTDVVTGTDLHPMDPTQAMVHIIRSFYPLAILPGPESALRAFYHSTRR